MPAGRLATIVVPCFNEAARLPVARFLEFVERHPDVRFAFVDDGSTDGTAERVRELVQRDPAHFELVQQHENHGKAEAVRVGMLHALGANDAPAFAGYWDADLATPLDEIPRFIAALDAHPERSVCFGARVQLMGRSIERRALRHYLGRVFATVASLLLDLPVYDTQCGAKLFRRTPETTQLFAEPFCVRWTFDVELIARMKARATAAHEDPALLIYELPLDRWRDVAGSKVRAGDFFKAVFEVLRIWRRYLR